MVSHRHCEEEPWSPYCCAAGRRRSPATLPGYHDGRPPRNKGLRYPADPPTVEEPPARDVWTASRFISADPPDVLASLTDPQLITLWAPIDFEFDGLRGRRMRPGSHAFVNGSLAGVAAEFEIDVLRADVAGLRSRGPRTGRARRCCLALAPRKV